MIVSLVFTVNLAVTTIASGAHPCTRIFHHFPILGKHRGVCPSNPQEKSMREKQNILSYFYQSKLWLLVDIFLRYHHKQSIFYLMGILFSMFIFPHFSLFPLLFQYLNYSAIGSYPFKNCPYRLSLICPFENWEIPEFSADPAASQWLLASLNHYYLG